jgi:formylmethanofuran dehydrogenase subunit D
MKEITDNFEGPCTLPDSAGYTFETNGCMMKLVAERLADLRIKNGDVVKVEWSSGDVWVNGELRARSFLNR